jgi:D-arabinose 1-dehydrogenase-like Zn-dependent alcohol dehydrogenase
MAQSLKAIKIDGTISIIGFLAGSSKEQPGFLEALSRICTVRGILVGSRDQLEDMVSLFFFPSVLSALPLYSEESLREG